MFSINLYRLEPTKVFSSGGPLLPERVRVSVLYLVFCRYHLSCRSRSRSCLSLSLFVSKAMVCVGTGPLGLGPLGLNEIQENPFTNPDTAHTYCKNAASKKC